MKGTKKTSQQPCTVKDSVEKRIFLYNSKLSNFASSVLEWAEKEDCQSAKQVRRN